MTTATAQANPNIAFIKCTLAKLGRTNRKARSISKIGKKRHSLALNHPQFARPGDDLSISY